MGLSDSYWEERARRLLEVERERRHFLYPEPTGVMVEWRDGIYIGHIQTIVPDYSSEIVSLSKTSRPLEEDFTRAVRRLDPSRLDLIADNELDLDGPHHLVRRVEKRLTIMTLEQTR